MDDWQFWIAAGGMTAAVLAVLLLALRRAREGIAPAAAYDLQVYRDQLREVDRDLARGLIAEEDAQRIRTEVSRRLLEADRALADGPGVAAGRRIPVAALIVVVALAAGVWGYARLGAPGYPDLPLAERLAMAEEARAARPSQAAAEAAAPAALPRTDVDPAFLDLMEKLRAATRDRPGDPHGLELLARNEAALGNFVAARIAQEQLIAAKGAEATAEDHAGLAQLRVMAAGGVVTPEAESALIAALQLDPRNGLARYFSGLMFAQIGRPDQTFRLWEPLLRESPPDAPWVAPIRADIEAVAWRAGVEYTLPAENGPSAADIAAAGEMSQADRQAMIEGMVAQLGDRLASEGGTVEEWARLISSLATLGRTDEARTIYAEAQTRFAGLPAELGFLKEAALGAGIAE